MEVAKRSFLTQGFSEVSTPALVEEAGLTRGALYHHFRDKHELFAAVATEMAREVSDRVTAAAAALDDPMEALMTGARAYFQAMADEGRAQILLVQAPAVLDQTAQLALSDASGAQALNQGLIALLPAVPGQEDSLLALTQLLSAAFDRAALKVAQGESPTAYLEAVERIFLGLVPELEVKAR
ncbi:TetR/AcrR family transcriptional regulator [Pseudomarimonas arenosa]|uniref:Helix-turn-helix transcriptional regulator n=1 Tax=Pseudomarimonas arenosa TaxID=2774145 RepID=A0AAW3ZRS6_9GAMM|nr:TetR/AcrR family transcriptional regulator [Pseudomarimonas arenosa]MBD8526946.1 helix-turn-helix transcriptional regulator [Pseudomarimonas arenosa]